jgi:hypothetical protein
MRFEVRSYPIVTDRATASLLRETYLERRVGPTDEPVQIDLNSIAQLSVDAADELVGKFVEQLRKRNQGAIVFVIGPNWDVLRAAHAALRDRTQAALAINDQARRRAYSGADDQTDPVIPIGDVSPEERAAFQSVAQGNFNPALANVLTRLAEKGLIVANSHGTGYAVPHVEQPRVEYAV